MDLRLRFANLTPDEQRKNPDIPVDPWDEVDFAAKAARNTFHTVYRSMVERGETGEAHKLAVAYGQFMAMVWACEIAEPLRVHINNVLDKLGMLEEADNGQGGPPAGR